MWIPVLYREHHSSGALAPARPGSSHHHC